MTKRKQWEPQDLPLETIRTHRSLQFRHGGLDPANLRGLAGTLEAGGDTRDPIRVGRVGRALYLLDGHHRLEAYRKAARDAIPALVAKMSLQEAQDYARASNAMNGKSYTRVEKQALFEDYVAQGRHLDAMGFVKPSRVIAVELGGAYSHETVRAKLRGLGIELEEAVEFPGGYSPYYGGRTKEERQEELVEDAEEALRTFGAILPDLPSYDRERLVRAARAVLEGAEGGQPVDLAVLLPRCPLDI